MLGGIENVELWMISFLKVSKIVAFYNKFMCLVSSSPVLSFG
jgi:hypothetical protein